MPGNEPPEGGWKCFYPRCAKAGTSRVLVPIKDSKNGDSVELPLCPYHALIVGIGQFQVEKLFKKDNEEWNWKLIGPIEQVELVEAVIGAVEYKRREKIQD